MFLVRFLAKEQEAPDIRVDVFVDERLLRHPMTFQESISLEAVEAETLAESVVSENTPPKQVDGKCFANGPGKVRDLGPEPLLDLGRQAEGEMDGHALSLFA
jgi:hypothetical protein